MDAAISWRTTAVVAGAVAALELVALLVLGAALLSRPLAPHAGRRGGVLAATATLRLPQSHRRLPTAPVVRRLPRSRTRVLVLNGNGRQGAAGAAAQLLRRLGYRIGATRNAARMDYAASLVLYRPGYLAQGRRLARDARVRLVRPLDGLRPAQLRGSQLALILGR